MTKKTLKLWVAACCLFTSHFASANQQFYLRFLDSSVKYSVRFDKGRVTLAGNDFTFEIRRQPCSEKRIDSFRKKLEKSIASHRPLKAVADKPVTIVVQGVSSRFPVNDDLSLMLRRLQFDLFALRQATDRECRKRRSTASEGLPTMLDKISKVNKQDPSKDCTQCTAVAGQDRHSELESCLKALCPDESFSNAHLTEQALKLDAFQDSKFNGDFLPLVDKVLELEKARKKQRDDIVKKIMAGRKIENPEEVAIVETFRRILEIPYAAFDADAGGNTRLNIEELKRLRPEWSDTKIAEANNAIMVFSKSESENPVSSQPLDRLLQIHSSEAIHTFIKDKVKELQDRWVKLPTSAKQMTGYRGAEIESDIRRYGQIGSADEYPNDVLSTLNDNFKTLYWLENIPKDANFPSSLDTTRIFAEMKKNYAENFKSFEPPKKEKQDIRASCASTYSVLKAYSLNDEDHQRIKAQEKSFIAKFLDRTGSLMSSHSRQVIEQDSQKWKFALAPRRNEVISRFKATISAQAQHLQDVLKYKTDQVTAADILNFSTEDDEPESDLADICSKVGGLIRDAAFKDSRAVYISPIVGKLWPRASSIANHELGHLLDYAIRENAISEHTKKTKSEIDLCLKRQHPESKNSVNTLEEFKYAKENWADFTGQMADEKDAMGYECLSLKESYNIGEKLSLENEDPTDTHASNLFRGLSRYNFHHGSLPPSCLAALKEKGESPNFRDCRPKAK